ncbi:MAG: alpha/beta fold hydrolase [Gemmatimonadetes bacterium]|nr:alpha/beta fold hydrolase [Gemmatimonadota bacterium]MYA44343.1 alpha/beta fold hydrolase [Gemmatimonadota bacterium]MYE93199.1 alpha/beta fold hydrolase [Gemmatimonadota bacterium]MYJ12195.1 alpha/beta fold hydrolase [Gemmatimonadota bacterium]
MSAQVVQTRFVPARFRPAWWLRGRHAQTLAGKYLRSGRGLPLERRRVGTPDADFLDLDFAPEPAARAPLVLLLHGLEGSTQREYMSLMFRELFDRGLRGVGMNFRGCGGEPNRLPRAYHSGETGDLAHVIADLRRSRPGRRIGAAGFSLGGNVLLKYLGERRDAPGIDAAVAVSVPFDLPGSAERLSNGVMGRAYGAYFLRSLRRKVHEKRHLLNGEVDVDRTLAARTLKDFDDALTAPLHGFADADDYYARADVRRHLAHIGVPALLIQARDDPFLPRGATPDAIVAGHPYLRAAFTDRGGHLGFVEGELPWRPRFWAEREAARFLAQELRPG